jgi:uncharacterized membrane protein
MTTHVKVLAVLGLVLGALGLAGALFPTLFFGALATLVGTSSDEHAKLGLAVLGLTGIALTAYLVFTSAVSLLCGWGLLKRRRWARILGIVLAAISLIQFPLGTILGAYALWVLFNKKTEEMFAT